VFLLACAYVTIKRGCAVRQGTMAERTNWQSMVAPTLVEFEQLASASWSKLPGQFRKLCGDLIIRVEDFAVDEVLDELDIENPFDLMGLYQGVSVDKKSVLDVQRDPDMVFLYRRAILDYWADSDEPLGDIVTHVLVHEIGHHFGFSDADMEDLEASAGS
jgi:predicted Zn-dependent protease with MMP-like domain